MQYRTSDAASICKVTVNTVRNWCKDYGAFLSDGARGDGGNRSFNGRDLEVFKYIAQLRAENMQRPAILQRLSETTFAEIEEPTELAPIEAQQNVIESHRDTPALTVGHEYLVALERRLEAVEAGRKDFAQGIALGFIAALMFVLVIVGIAVLYGGFR